MLFPQESQTHVVTLNDDPPEGVDVLLEYLYTLAKPNFGKRAGQRHIRAEHAFTLGDKYGLPQLRSFGSQMLVQCVNSEFSTWHGKPDRIKQRMLGQIERIWSWQLEGSDFIRDICLWNLSRMPQSEPDSMMRDERFVALVSEQRQFSLDLI